MAKETDVGQGFVVNKEDKAIKQATELAEQFDNIVTIYAATENDVVSAVPIMAALGIISKYAGKAGSSLEEVLEKQLEGIKRRNNDNGN